MRCPAFLLLLGGLRGQIPGTKVEFLPPALDRITRLPGRTTPLDGTQDVLDEVRG